MVLRICRLNISFVPVLSVFSAAVVLTTFTNTLLARNIPWKSRSLCSVYTWCLIILADVIACLLVFCAPIFVIVKVTKRLLFFVIPRPVAF